MIIDPPLLTIRAGFPRPAQDLVAAFSGAAVSQLVDAMGGGGAIDYRIRPLAPVPMPMVGVALTCDTGPADNLALFGALSIARQGDVLVAATGAWRGGAVTGDLVLRMARNRGVAGFVTDGMVRDVAGILEIGMPVYCAGISANSPARNGPGTVGEPIAIGGLRIESGDIVIGDRDGLVVVPLAHAAGIVKNLATVRAAETALEAEVRNGLEIPEFIAKILASDRVRRVD
jgi:4-hydroxy-4-methyl-2-oxoglutarate aldolase